MVTGNRFDQCMTFSFLSHCQVVQAQTNLQHPCNPVRAIVARTHKLWMQMKTQDEISTSIPTGYVNMGLNSRLMCIHACDLVNVLNFEHFSLSFHK